MFSLVGYNVSDVQMRSSILPIKSYLKLVNLLLPHEYNTDYVDQTEIIEAES